MKPALTKRQLQKALPIRAGASVVRGWTRADLERLADWPKYPFPYEGFEFSFKAMDPAGRDRLFEQRDGKTDSLPLVIDQGEQAAIGYIALARIDWAEGRVGNFGFRIHPDWVDRGIGSAVLGVVCQWCFDLGMSAIGVDVAASNGRAVRCYQKAGFQKVGETWRPADDLEAADLGASRYDFLRPHLRREAEGLKLRFVLMEKGRA